LAATGGAGGGFAGAGAGAAAAGDGAVGAFGFVTRNECPHFGHRIFNPVGGTRRSSIWYGALHDSHSTLSIGDRQRNTHRARFSDDNRAPRLTLAAVIDVTQAYEAQLDARAEALATVCVHAGEEPDPRTRALDVPIVMASAFGFASADDAAGAFEGKNDAYIYGRWGNPTVEALEAKLAALEGTEDACVTASGMAAITGAVTAFCGAGDHVVAPRSMYAEAARLLRERLPRFGIETTFVDATQPGAYERALRPGTRLLYLETPANPNLAVTDLAAIAALARSRGIRTVADNTFATPFAQNPHALGVDVVVHSMTKGLGGHGDAIGGCVCGRREDVARIRDLVVKGFGGVISPFNAFLVTRGLRTFALRQRQQCASAAVLASRLSTHPRVAVVHHPSLPSHPGRALACRQMHAFGALLSFELREESGKSVLSAGKRVLESVKTITHAVSLGDARSLLVHPASTTHSTMPAADRLEANISDGLLRLSVGIEGTEDLWRDLSGALAAAG
jgi:methionine-gamma-lyase